MPYRRTTRKSTRRTQGRTLRKWSIATKTSAKSQARQIYALNRKVSRIYRQVKPDVQICQWQNKILQSDGISTTMPVNSFSAVQWRNDPSDTTSYQYQLVPPRASDDISATDVSQGFKIDYMRIRGFTITGLMQYPASTSESPADQQPIVLRMVVVQTTRSRGSSLAADDIFTSSIDGTSSRIATVGPLQSGLSGTCTVLADRRYVLDQQHPTRMIKIRTRPSNVRFDTESTGYTDTESVDKGTIFVFYTTYCLDSNERFVLDLVAKMAYTN